LLKATQILRIKVRRVVENENQGICLI
jgi:hypothetical protein